MPNVQLDCRWNYLYANVFSLDKLMKRLDFVIHLHKALDRIKFKLDWHIVLVLMICIKKAGVKFHFCLSELKQLHNFFLE
jgi:hypothetical protein